MATPSPDPTRRDSVDQDRLRLVTFLHGIVEQETGRLVHGKVPWATWLEQAARHGRYGFANALLINAQRPTATQVRSYREWQKQGRQVRRGETGIRILTRRGEPRSVFDLLQTEGPSAGLTQPFSPAQIWGLMTSLAADLGLWIERNERWVYTGPPGRVVHVEPALDDHAATVLLAHQLVHVRLHDGVLDQPDGGAAACHGVRRLEADSASYLLMAHVGTPAQEIRFPAVTSWAGTDLRANPSAAVMAVSDRVLSTTAWLAKRLGQPADVVPAEPAVRRPGVSLKDRDQSAVSEPDSGAALDELMSIQAEAHMVFLQRWEPSWVPGYLTERGFSPQVQQQWGIGFAPKDWRALTDHLRRCGYSETAIVASGLARRDRNGRLFDTFRDRAMLPIRRPDGAIAGFIGRARAGAEGPKFLNSPTSDLFRKGELLYGLHEVRDRLARGVQPVIVEGPFDAIAINTTAPETHAAVAPCGTTITARHLAALADVADLDTVGLLLALDGDQAGQTAMLRTWSVLAQVSGPLQAALLPNAQDPADILRYQGCMAVREALTNVVSLTGLVIDAIIERTGPTLRHPEDRLAAVRAAASVLAQRPPSEFAQQVTRIATRLSITPGDVTSALLEAISAEKPSPGRLAHQGFPRPPAPLPAEAGSQASAGGSQPQSTTRRTR